VAPARFHEQMAERQARWPDAMTTLSTHDTKRGEDVRARITALAEMPERWMHALARLLELAPLPDPGFGSLLWQAAAGAWPISRERLHAYAEKAMREAGDHTTWTSPDPAYEDAVHAAVDAAYDDPRVSAVIDELLTDLVGPGWSNALAAKLVALTMPGVPDVYQGSELWEQSLVDPDNRRFVDFDARAGLLDSLTWGTPPAVTGRPEDPGAAKLAVTRSALTLRRDRPELFTAYEPITASGAAADHVIAFDRGGAVTVATRLPVGLAAGGGWGTTTLDLPAGTWRDVITGAVVTTEDDGQLLDEVLGTLPVALLVREES
jgi:(1->4)-alpha-D-glucan 1-alpha-D-glucosylmutase